ncbi:RdgB/HAM1 family non-canonical purine NTP pyrophosphatase [Mycoplasma feriruminatoris]|uniref:RdgB/HAM1 family non-canonical purine NTP pyrophosphatase n=1 Tax=Mycoplasma feriruminatoris TaxID=1179777 RepID=UPI0002A4FA25|nr:RdgB/HAM1 family non-canonical purine NTP pyrophosphatase [Mycoplasma feriruminatoris]UKS54005.1 Non-canonical purine NTP pyrophosphatase HAM1 protein [Mycoplasma feriruminatoris]VZK65172.1 dITP/XTP pyrophosphatase [Mycoplasma feriruminatoris]VZR75318.1 dITP/XTP pyrophosphatase [Mycoplasma feriruminatoris]VZR97477.1 dITP/XTP pyrophosphatase [Mycoplasma feriruminatoris]
MNKKVIYLATTNKNKVKEFSQILKDYEIKSLLDIPNYVEIKENKNTFKQNALLKAKHLAKYINGVAIGDDTGICVKALNDFPGIYSKRWAYPLTNHYDICNKLLDKLKHINQLNKRKAYMTTAIALYDVKSKKQFVYQSRANGYIDFQVNQSDFGFGYDFIFIPKGYDKTYSLLDSDLKNQISARKKAIDKLIDYIDNVK